jgi:Secretion system C-terminal sorting domain
MTYPAILFTIAQDAINYYNYEDVARFLDMEHLFALLEDDAVVLASDATLAAFYNSLQNTDLAALHNIDNKLSTLYDTDPLANPIQWQTLYDEIATLNENLEAATAITEHEQWINTILLYLAHHNIEEMEPTTLAQVKTLALECPYIAGDAVFKARHILAPLETNVRYDDLNICNNQGVYKGGVNTFNIENQILLGSSEDGQQSNTINNAKIYPNPSDGILKIDYSIADDGILQLYDISGRLIRTIALPKDTRHIVTEIDDLIVGIYTYKITVSGILLSNGKLVKN